MRQVWLELPLEVILRCIVKDAGLVQLLRVNHVVHVRVYYLKHRLIRRAEREFLVSGMTIDTDLAKQFSCLHVPATLRHQVVCLPVQEQSQVVRVQNVIFVGIQCFKQSLVTVFEAVQVVVILNDDF